MSRILQDIAYSLGVTAFKNGKMCIPAWDKDLEKNCLTDCKNVGDGIPYYQAWLDGWIDASLGKHAE
jgi:hypothetical protein